jgi:hypothetical protein
MTALQDRAVELCERAEREAVPVRLLGGMGIRLLLGDRLAATFARPVGDLDLLTSRRAAEDVERLLPDLGWEPNEQFNALNGARRMLFHCASGGPEQVDVFVEAFEMCHRLPLADSLRAPGRTLPPSDLLMTKLQIVELNAKDRNDALALLSALPVAADGIDPGRVAALTARDWGLHHTFELNLRHLREHAPDSGLDAGGRDRVARGVDALLDAMEREPKSRAWKLRARVGERRRWYEDVEEVERA